MSSKKISEMPDGGALQGTDEIPVYRPAGSPKNQKVLGSVIVFGSTDTIILDILGAPSGTAPGAGKFKIEAVPGTDSGTAKLICYAGSSSTPKTIIDNVGAGI